MAEVCCIFAGQRRIFAGEPVVDKGDTILNIVRLVDMACHKLGIGLIEDATISLAATAEGQSLEVSELMSAQLEIMLEDFAASGGTGL